jgi:hypothetical protein
MASAGDVVVTISLKDLISKEAQDAASRTNAAFGLIQSGASKAASGTIGALKGLVGGVKGYFDGLVAHYKWASAIVGGFLIKEATEAFDMAAKFERFSIAAEALTGSSEAANKFVQSVKTLTRETMFNIDQIAELESRLIGNTKSVEVSDDALRQLSIAVQATGGGYSELESAVRAWIQTNSKAYASSEELNRQFGNANIPMIRLLAESVVNGVNPGLEKYIQQAGASTGVTKTMTTSYEKAKDTVKWTSAEIKNATDKLKDWESSGKKTDYQLNELRLTIQKKEAALGKAQTTIDKYTGALKLSAGAGKAAKLTVEEVIAQLQELGDLKIPGGVMGEATIIAIKNSKEYQEAFEKVRKTATYQVQLIQDNFKMLTLSIMGLDDQWKPLNNGIMNLVTKALIPLNEWLEKNEKRIGEFGKTLGENRDAAIFLASALFGILYPALFGLVIPILGGAAVFGLLGLTIVKLIDHFIGLDNVLKGVKIFFENLPAIIETADNNLRSFIGKILGVQGKKMNWELGMEVAAPPSWDQIASGFDQKVVQPMKQKIQDLKDSFVFGNIQSPIPATWEEVATKFFDKVKEIGVFIQTALKPVFDSWKESMQELMPTLQTLLPILGQILGIVVILGGAILTGFLAGLAPLLTGVVQIFTGILSIISGFFQLLFGLFTANGTMIQAGWSQMWTGVLTLFSGFQNVMFNAGEAFIKGFLGFFTALSKLLIGDGDNSTFGKMFIDVVDGISKWKKGVDEATEKIVKSISKFFTDMVENAKTWGSDLIKNFINGVINNAKEAAKKGFLGPLGSLGAGALEAISNMHFQHGGIVPGAQGEAVPIIAHAGERITPRAGVDRQRGFGETGISINISGTFNLDDSARVNELARSISRVFGRQLELAQLGAGY